MSRDTRDPIAVVDLRPGHRGRVRWSNRRGAAWTVRPGDLVRNHAPEEHVEAVDQMLEHLADHTGTVPMPAGISRATGPVRWDMVRAGDGPESDYGIIRIASVSEGAAMNDQRRQNDLDDFVERVRYSMTRLSRQSGVVGVVGVDLKRAEESASQDPTLADKLRESYTHAAARISSVARSGDSVVQVAEHQIAVLVEVRTPLDLDIVIARISRTIGEPFSVGGDTIRIGSGVASAYAEGNHGDPAALVAESLHRAREARLDPSTRAAVDARGGRSAGERSMVALTTPGPRELDGGMPTLTSRERETLARMCAGQSTSVMADSMGISITTVRTHVRAVLSKLGAHSRVEAVAVAVRNGLVSRHEP
ncbi:response regulator transcription factor [Solicola sp. PLA-1-18]|uniref:response regulator transcription factor n=1 Tax=Solicola sp. PLA-1-18 TaxID=3380532 RepID=UPI003B7DAAF4